jgi:hypothetical protein
MFSLDRILSPYLQSRFPREEGYYTHESKVFRHRQGPALSCPQRGLLTSFFHAEVCWSHEALQNLKFQAPNLRVLVFRFQCSGFSVQVSRFSFCVFFLTPDTRHLKPPVKLTIFTGKAIQF